MQDKPALQQALSRDLASLVSSMRTPVVLPFIRAFWLTMAREWSHIEALRLDKYLYLIRQYLNASFQFLSRQKWGMDKLKQWNTIVEETPFNVEDMKIPNGLRYHVLDIWVDEMDKVAGKKWDKEVKSDEMEELVKPIEHLAENCKLRTIRDAAKECLAEDRLRAWRGQEEIVQAEEEEEEADDGWEGFGDE
jgi:ribosomal RNA-processing protein 1